MKRVFAHIGFSFALTLIIVNIIGVSVVPALTAALALVFIASLILPKYREAAAVPVCLGSALLACFVFLSVYYSTVYPQNMLDKVGAFTSFYITDLPSKTDFGYSYIARAVTIEKDGAVQNIKIRIVTDSRINAEAYRIINGKLKFYSLGGNAFSSYGYWGKGIFLSARLEDYSVTSQLVNSPMRYFLQLRALIIETLVNGVKGDEGALAAALITGNKEAMSFRAADAFKNAGVTHLMAISGFHLTVVSGSVTFVLKKLGVPKWIYTAAAIIVIVLFSVMTGFSKSVLRAGIMMISILSSGVFGRRGDTLNSLGLSAFLICINPFAVSDVGAVLSITSVLSLSVFYPKVKSFLLDCIEKYWYIKAALNGFAGYPYRVMLASFCILIFNLPAMYVFFGYFSLAGLFANVLLLPLGSLSTVMSFLTFAFARAGIIGKLFMSADGFINKLMLKLVSYFASGAYSVVSTGDYLGIIIGVMLVAFALCFFLRNKKMLKYALAASMCVLIVYQGAVAVTEGKHAHVFISENGACAVICEGKTVVAGVKSRSDYYSVSAFLSRYRTNIDLLAVQQNREEINEKLIEEFECEKIVSPSFNQTYLDGSVQAFTVEKSYFEQVSDGVTVSLYPTSGGYAYDVRVFGIDITNYFEHKENIISVNKKYIRDDYGTIELNSDVVYTVKANKAYYARKVEVWED